MEEDRRITRSAGARSRNTQQSEAQFWSAAPDPVQIERGRREAVDLAYEARNRPSGPQTNMTEETTEVNNINEVTNYTVSTAAMAPLTYVNDEEDDEGLQEQFLTEDEGDIDDIPDIPENRVVTPVGEQSTEGPLNPRYTQQMARSDLDVQPSKGPRKQQEDLGDTIGAFMDEGYEDILRTSQLRTSFSMLSFNSALARPAMPLAWIVPDQTNRTLEEITDKKIANGVSPGGGTGAVIVCLPNLEEAFTTKYFLVDLEMGEVFAFITQMWRCTGLYCARQPHNTEDLKRRIKSYSRAMKMELENEDQTPLTQPHNENRTFTPPPLPLMDDPEVYMTHSDVMHITTRRNYVRDRMRAAITYINEYQETHTRLAGDNSHMDTMLTRLRIIYGRVDAIRDRIDTALLMDDMFRRRRNMRSMPLPTRFPSPQMMGQVSITAWTTWIRTETNKIMMAVEEELQHAGDPDDPFDGTAGGIFAPPPTLQPTVPQPIQQPMIPAPTQQLTLPPPTHTPEQQKNKQAQKTQETPITTEGIEYSIQSSQIHPGDRRPEISGELVGSAQALTSEGIEHSIHSHNNNDTIKEMHAQQRRKKQEGPVQQETPTRQQNLITFTPTPTRNNHGAGIPEVADIGAETRFEATQPMPQQNPMPQRVPKQREGQEAPNQAQPGAPNMPHMAEEREQEVNQTINQSQPEVSHIPHIEEEAQREVHLTQGERDQEQDTSYMQVPRTLEHPKGKPRLCWRCGEAGHSKRVCKAYVYCEICQNYSHATQACFRYENFVRNNPIASSCVTSPVNNYERNIQG